MAKLPPKEDYALYLEKIHVLYQFSQRLGEDFRKEAERVTGEPFTWRAVIRAFGSFADGYTAMLKGICVASCELYGKKQNEFLIAKFSERTTTSYHRIKTCYRLIEECFPGSPFTRIPEERWRDLKKAIEIRNRILHPETSRDLEIEPNQVPWIIEIAAQFTQDGQAFFYFIKKLHEQCRNENQTQQIRLGAKTGRNELCPCASELKFKNCCGKALQHR